MINISLILICTIPVLIIGMFLGAWLGRLGSFQAIAFFLQFPFLLLKSPRSIKAKIQMLKEVVERQKLERLKRIEKIKILKERLGKKEKEVKVIQLQMRKLRWEDLKENEEV